MRGEYERNRGDSMKVESRVEAKSILQWLDDLEATGLVRRLNESEPAYLFKHTLTQETAYQSLLNRSRRDIHLQVANVVQALYPDRLDQYAALLAYHYAEGGDDAQALVYEIRAGDVAARLFAHAEAIGHYTRALGIATSAEAIGYESARDLYSKRGRVFELSGRYDSALENYVEMQALARERGDRALELGALISIAALHAIPTPVFDPQQAQQFADDAIALARELNDRASESRIFWMLMILKRWVGDPAGAVRYGEKSLEIARECNLREQVAFTLNDLVVHGYYNTGEFHKALNASEQARELWREMNNLPMLADNYGSSGIVNYPLGNFDQVIAESSEALAISERIGNLWGQSYAQWIVGNVHSDRGEPRRAVQVMENSIRIGEQGGFAGAEVGVRNALAITLAHYGLVDQGLDIVQQAVEIVEGRFAAWKHWSYAVLARIYTYRGKIAQAEAIMKDLRGVLYDKPLTQIMPLILFQICMADTELAITVQNRDANPAFLDSILQYLKKSQARGLMPEPMLAKGKILIARNELDDAAAILSEARGVAEARAARRVLWQIYSALAEIHERRGDYSKANSLRSQAREMIEYIAAHATEEQRAAFLNLPNVRTILAPS